MLHIPSGKEIISQFNTRAYATIPVSITRKSFEEAAEVFDRMNRELTLEQKNATNVQLNSNILEYQGYRTKSSPLQPTPNDVCNYAPGMDKFIDRTAAGSQFIQHARPLYQSAGMTLDSIIGSIGEQYPVLPTILSFEQGKGNFFLRFLRYTAGFPARAPGHYDPWGLTLWLYQDKNGLHVGFNEEDSKPIAYQENLAVVHNGVEFERLVSETVPLSWHFVRGDESGRIAILMLAFPLNSSFDQQSMNTVREYHRVQGNESQK